MKTEVAILHHEYPNVIREHVATKLQNLVRFYDGTVSVRAVLERQGDDHRAELIAAVRRGVTLVVDARAASIKQALDTAVDRMGRVLSRHKNKLKEEGRRRAPHHRH
ncbi:MAG: HPF/RaiA family ribosome-associated protein [Planctomycetota bacterium]